jgi:hypothetical protein
VLCPWRDLASSVTLLTPEGVSGRAGTADCGGGRTPG